MDPAAAEERRLHAAHVEAIARDREQRQKFARAHKDVDNVLYLIGNVLWISLFAAGARFATSAFTLFDYAATGELEGEETVLEAVLAATLAAAVLVMLVVMKRQLKQAPVRVAGAVAVLATLAAAVALWDVFGVATVAEGVPLPAASLALLAALLALFHVYAFLALRKNRATILHLRHVRAE